MAQSQVLITPAPGESLDFSCVDRKDKVIKDITIENKNEYKIV